MKWGFILKGTIWHYSNIFGILQHCYLQKLQPTVFLHTTHISIETENPTNLTKLRLAGDVKMM